MWLLPPSPLSLFAGGGQSLEVGSTSLGNIGGLLRDESSVGVGGERGGDGGNSHMVSEPGVEVGGGSQTGDQVDGHLCFTLLPSSLSNGSEMGLTGLNNISGLGRDKGTIGMSSEGGSDWGNGNVSEETTEVRGDNVGGSHTGDQVDRHLRFALLTSIHNGTSRVHVGGTNKGVVAMGSLGGVVVGGGGGNVRVEGSNGAVGVGDQVGSGVKHLCLPLSVVVDRVDKARSMNSEGVDQLASLSIGLQVSGGCGGIVGVVRGNGAIGVVHQLGRGTSNKERADYQELHDAQSSNIAQVLME